MSQVIAALSDPRRPGVHRQVIDGEPIYVKAFGQAGVWERTADSEHARCSREIEIIRRLPEVPGLGGRLGVVSLVAAEPHDAVLATREVPGRTLSRALAEDYRHHGRRCLWAIYLAGRWIRRFQRLSTTVGDTRRIGDRSPEALVEYCRLRLDALRSLGCAWVTPRLGEATLERIRALCDRAEASDRTLVWSHGDYASNNVIWDGRTLTPIDFAMANLDVSLKDVTYFLHRLAMLPVYFPWRRWPTSRWAEAFLRGYGRPDAGASPMYQALSIRHLLCRLVTYHHRDADTVARRLHLAWVRSVLRRRLERAVSSSGADRSDAE